MKCEEAVERIPWLLSQTLEPAEEHRLRRHLEGCERCRAEVSPTARLLRAAPGHPASEVLARLAAGEDSELTAEERRAAAAHVAECERCAEAVRLARESNEELERVSRKGVVELPAVRPRPRRWRHLAAAAVLLAAVGLGFSIDNLLRSAEGVAEVRWKNVALVELPMGIDRGGADELEYAGEEASLRLEFGDLPPGAIAPEDRVRLLTAEGEVLFEVGGLVPDPIHGLYSFEITGGLPAGLLRVEIVDPEGKVERKKSFRLVPYREGEVRER